MPRRIVTHTSPKIRREIKEFLAETFGPDAYRIVFRAVIQHSDEHGEDVDYMALYPTLRASGDLAGEYFATDKGEQLVSDKHHINLFRAWGHASPSKAAMPNPPRRRSRIHYWPTFEAAREVVRQVGAKWPEARVVHYGRGFAVQIRKSGDYLARDLRPSSEVEAENPRRRPARGDTVIGKLERAFRPTRGRRGHPFERFRFPYTIDKWEERDRLHIALKDADDNTIIEWWDDDARQLFEDGWLDRRNLLGSATDYAKHLGVL